MLSLAGLCLLGIARAEAIGQCRYDVTIIPKRHVCDAIQSPNAINASGEVGGAARCALGQFKAFTWPGEGNPIDIPLPDGTTQSAGFDINDRGDMVGCLSIRDDGMGDLAFLFDGVDTHVLDPLPGNDWSEARGVSNDGVAVGFSRNGTPRVAVAWIEGDVIDLSDLVGLDTHQAMAINERQQIVGHRSGEQQPFATAYRLDLKSGELVDVGVTPGGTSGRAVGVNNRGDVVGSGSHPAGTRSFAWFSGEIVDLGVLPDKTQTNVFDVNDRRVVVGESSVNGVANEAFIWIDGVMTNLNDLVDLDEHVFLRGAQAINNVGTITFQAIDRRTGAFIAGVLTPVSPPRGDVTGDCRVDLMDLLLVLSEWGPCEFCFADVNEDGTIDEDDLVAILLGWS